MPGDLGSSSIGILDVQFGALDLASETITFLTDNVSSTVSNSVTNTDKYNTVVSFTFFSFLFLVLLHIFRFHISLIVTKLSD